MENKLVKRGGMIAGICLALAAGMGLVSCSVFNRTGTSSAGKDSVLPNDRETLQQPKKQNVYTSEELAKGIIKGDWTIEEVEGRKAVGQKVPYLRFEPGEKKVYGNNGCNVLNADYTYNPADSTMRFENVITTMMLCPEEGITETEINRAVNDTRRYTWQLDGHDYRLTLLNGAGEKLMTMVHCNFEFLNGTWHITAINGEPADVKGMNLLIDVDEGKLHGNTGCNIMNGKVETDLETPNSISFSAIATTRMMCPDIESETRLVVALEEAVTAKAVNADTVELIGSNGTPVIRMVRTDPSEID